MKYQEVQDEEKPANDQQKGAEDVSGDSEEQWAEWVSKTLVLVAIMLAVLFGSCHYASQIPGFTTFVLSSRGMYIILTSFIIAVGLAVYLLFSESASKEYPLNYVYLSVFTLLVAFLFSALCAFASLSLVDIVGETIIFYALLIAGYAYYSKGGFSFLYAYALVLMTAGAQYAYIKYSVIGATGVQIYYAALISLIFGLYIVFDIWLLKKTKRLGLEPSNHVLGAVSVFIDVVGIFIVFIKYVGGKISPV